MRCKKDGLDSDSGLSRSIIKGEKQKSKAYWSPTTTESYPRITLLLLNHKEGRQGGKRGHTAALF